MMNFSHFILIWIILLILKVYFPLFYFSAADPGETVDVGPWGENPTSKLVARQGAE
jgi:hypothetical protein